MCRAVLGVAVLLLGAGCASDPEEPSTATADCASQIRVDDEVFTGYAFTHRHATEYGVADVAECHDVGMNPDGLVFPDDPRQVRTWVFQGYSPVEVLGVRSRQGGFAVFIADSVVAEQRDEIANELGLSTSGGR